MQESRLFKILYCLLDKETVKASELAEKFEVSVRTVYRDIEALSGAGIPVYTEPGRNGGIRLINGFTLDRVILSEEEKQKILTGLQSLNAAQSLDNSDILDKLSGLFKTNTEDWLEADFSRWGDNKTDNARFEFFKSAIINRKSAKITYAGSDGSVNERIIYPLKLSYKAYAWYLKAYCTRRKDYRLFKLNRILDFKLSGDSFSPRSYPESEETDESISERVVLLFSKEMAYRVYDEFDVEHIHPQPDGDFLVCAHMPADSWLTGFLLSFGTNVTVLEPAYMKDVLAKQGKLIYEKNKT